MLVFVVMAVVLVVRPHGPARPRRCRRCARPAAPPLVRPAPPALRWLGAAALRCAAVVAPLLVGPYALSVLTEAILAVLFAASLHFMMGPGGMPSFGHAA